MVRGWRLWLLRGLVALVIAMQLGGVTWAQTPNPFADPAFSDPFLGSNNLPSNQPSTCGGSDDLASSMACVRDTFNAMGTPGDLFTVLFGWYIGMFFKLGQVIYNFLIIPIADIVGAFYVCRLFYFSYQLMLSESDAMEILSTVAKELMAIAVFAFVAWAPDSYSITMKWTFLPTIGTGMGVGSQIMTQTSNTIGLDSQGSVFVPMSADCQAASGMTPPNSSVVPTLDDAYMFDSSDASKIFSCQAGFVLDNVLFPAVIGYYVMVQDWHTGGFFSATFWVQLCLAAFTMMVFGLGFGGLGIVISLYLINMAFTTMLCMCFAPIIPAALPVKMLRPMAKSLMMKMVTLGLTYIGWSIAITVGLALIAHAVEGATGVTFNGTSNGFSALESFLTTNNGAWKLMFPNAGFWTILFAGINIFMLFGVAAEFAAVVVGGGQAEHFGLAKAGMPLAGLASFGLGAYMGRRLAQVGGRVGGAPFRGAANLMREAAPGIGGTATSSARTAANSLRRGEPGTGGSTSGGPSGGGPTGGGGGAGGRAALAAQAAGGAASASGTAGGGSSAAQQSSGPAPGSFSAGPGRQAPASAASGDAATSQPAQQDGAGGASEQKPGFLSRAGRAVASGLATGGQAVALGAAAGATALVKDTASGVARTAAEVGSSVAGMHGANPSAVTQAVSRLPFGKQTGDGAKAAQSAAPEAAAAGQGSGTAVAAGSSAADPGSRPAVPLDSASSSTDKASAAPGARPGAFAAAPTMRAGDETTAGALAAVAGRTADVAAGVAKEIGGPKTSASAGAGREAAAPAGGGAVESGVIKPGNESHVAPSTSDSAVLQGLALGSKSSAGIGAAVPSGGGAAPPAASGSHVASGASVQSGAVESAAAAIRGGSAAIGAAVSGAATTVAPAATVERGSSAPAAAAPGQPSPGTVEHVISGSGSVASAGTGSHTVVTHEAGATHLVGNNGGVQTIAGDRAPDTTVHSGSSAPPSLGSAPAGGGHVIEHVAPNTTVTTVQTAGATHTIGNSAPNTVVQEISGPQKVVVQEGGSTSHIVSGGTGMSPERIAHVRSVLSGAASHRVTPPKG